MKASVTLNDSSPVHCLCVFHVVTLSNILLYKKCLSNDLCSYLAVFSWGKSTSRSLWQADWAPAGPVDKDTRGPDWWVERKERIECGWNLGCARALGLDPKQPGAWEQLGLSAATWMDLLLSCLHSLMLAALLLLLLACRLLWKAHRCSLGWLPSKALLENQVVLGLLALTKHLYWWVESTTVVTAWHLAYLRRWVTCLWPFLTSHAPPHSQKLMRPEVRAQECHVPDPLDGLFGAPIFPSSPPSLPLQQAHPVRWPLDSTFLHADLFAAASTRSHSEVGNKAGDRGDVGGRSGGPPQGPDPGFRD
ncbi:hypothetical protein QTO34_013595 [Cnephaeus nilssonii]|uniref:Uncharacterized protein n=1 Tax=Cnephaeus nilssonii TaxID=3371016 RepID=A0AA40I8K3_CNENI|nr:hypothetical protein QTO34_013595 [Eptesicus nilssonii]